MEQTSIFDFIYDEYKITKPIRLIEFFAGYGSQALALKYLGANFEHHKICEWAVPSIQAYKDLHFTNDNTDYSKDYDYEYIYNYLVNKGISSNYNEPMSEKQVKALGEDKMRTIYNNIIATHNLVNIQQVKGNDLEIVDKDKYEYILTYSFPCQDLSLAGKGKGMADTNTRSGMLWEVERILKECKDLPQILLMENVPQVHGLGNVEHFNKWVDELEKLGYKSYFQDLNAKHYGIPQNRDRCFMVSILGDYNYVFPNKTPLKLKLKDMLEDNVDEKYFLSDKMIQGMINTNFESYKLENKLLDKDGVANTTIARFEGTQQCIEIKNATKKGYLEAYEGDGVDISGRMETHRGTVQRSMAQTIKTSIDVGVVVNDNNMLKRQLCNSLIENNMVEEMDVIRHSYTNSRLGGDMKDIKEKGVSPTLDTRCDCLGVCVKDEPQVIGGIGEKKSNGGTQWYQQDRIYDNNVSLAVTTCCNPNYIDNNLRIRKLTPKECFRLMGVKDEDFENIAKNQSNSKLWHLAGDSIVVNVLMGIFKQML